MGQKQDVEEQDVEEERHRSSTATASDESWETDMEIPTSPPKSDFEVVVDEKESAITQDSDEDVKIIDTDISAVTASKNTVDGNVTDENELLESTNDAVGSIIDGNIVSEVVQDEIPLDNDDILTKEEEDILI